MLLFAPTLLSILALVLMGVKYGITKQRLTIIVVVMCGVYLLTADKLGLNGLQSMNLTFISGAVAHFAQLYASGFEPKEKKAKKKKKNK